MRFVRICANALFSCWMKHVEISAYGIVQGVGFRPFVHRLAKQCALSGSVCNSGSGALIHVQGEEEDISGFLKRLEEEAPPLCRIETLECRELPCVQMSGFHILESSAGERNTMISPDIAPCADCLRELDDPADRRYRYPFINCTNCGPRYSIITDIPYDRCHTTMSEFEMCADCAKEYGDPMDRRYHAQPDACAACGPKLIYRGHGEASGEAALRAALRDLKAGRIVAVKGVGGIHLAVDACNKAAVLRLRARKQREAKPFAVMTDSVRTARYFASVSAEEEKLLTSRQRPIVLCRKHRRDAFLELSENQDIGLFLPYSPLHVLLAQECSAMVMTSANRSDAPVLIDNEAALQALDGIADSFLLHDRRIANRCDDSLVRCVDGRAYFLRRSRGYAPAPLMMHAACSGILALGAHEKGSFALGKGHHALLSPYIGNMENWETMQHYRHTLQTYARLFDVRPKLAVCDLHPDYASTQLARSLDLPLLQVQHHHAHMASCMAEHHLRGPAFGIIWDGTGLGEDGTLWGAEFLRGGYQEVRRVGSIRPILLAGGERAIHEIGRIAAALCHDAGIPLKGHEEIDALLAKEHLCVRSTGMGRLFDGVYALLAHADHQAYDAQAPTLLESMADPSETTAYPLVIEERDGVRVFDWRTMIRALMQDQEAGVSHERIAARFMNTLCAMALDQCRALNPEHLPVVLSGGSFLNLWLLQKIRDALQQEGYAVYWHQHTSCSDEGIALGQLAIAMERM